MSAQKITYAGTRQGLRGEEGILVAVIDRATRDALGGRARTSAADVADARAYFAGDTYRAHLSLLGMPTGYMPEVFEMLIARRHHERTRST